MPEGLPPSGGRGGGRLAWKRASDSGGVCGPGRSCESSGIGCRTVCARGSQPVLKRVAAPKWLLQMLPRKNEQPPQEQGRRKWVLDSGKSHAAFERRFSEERRHGCEPEVDKRACHRGPVCRLHG